MVDLDPYRDTLSRLYQEGLTVSEFAAFLRATHDVKVLKTIERRLTEGAADRVLESFV